jgi:tetratricopeptide (TPR) repeat protein
MDAVFVHARHQTFAQALVVVLSVFMNGTALADAPSWATSQAIELTRQGIAQNTQGDGSAATRRLLEAMSFDPTYGPAYLALGAIHEAGGDLREAERVYTTGLERVAGFTEGHAARAKLFRRLGRLQEAALDFAAALSLSPDDPLVLEGICETYIALGALPAALATSRRIEAIGEERGEAKQLETAHARSRALALLLGDVDPVATGSSKRGLLRSAIARHAMGRRNTK